MEASGPRVATNRRNFLNLVGLGAAATVGSGLLVTEGDTVRLAGRCYAGPTKVGDTFSQSSKADEVHPYPCG